MRKPDTKRLNHAIDALMVAFLPMLMAYSLIGETFHEIAGTIMFVLFLLHQWFHRKWWKALTKGRYTPYRIFITILNIALLVLMFMQPLSGIALSKHLYTGLSLTGLAAAAREIHMLLAYWSYVLMSLHLGVHMDAMVKAISRKRKAYDTKPGFLKVASAAISAYGIYAFIRRGFPGYMLMQTMFAFFDYGEPRLYFFIDYLAIMVLFATCGYLAALLLKRSNAVRG